MAASEMPEGFVDPQLLAATRRLALTARRLVAGAVSGLHASRRPGLAREFSQYRAYQPGDEPRHIDWKLFARSDRFFLRESDLGARIAIGIVLDATASMQHRDDRPGAPRTFDLARPVAAAVALLAENQGDTVTLHIVGRGQVRSVVTAGQRQPFQRIVQALASVTPGGRWPVETTRLAEAFHRTEREAASSRPASAARVTVVLTDGHEPGGEIRAALAPLRTRRHDLLFFHFRSRDEREFPYRGPVRFEEWETGRILETDASAARPAYLAAEAREREAWRHAWGADCFDYLELMTDEEPAPALRAYLRRRARS